MSLNGLDDVKVTEAYQGALAEAGGWFLLKYTSRDAIDVLARGAGGAADARSAIAQYQEQSPLYGFLLYRRRKVLIKYVPEETSRLLKARVAVHFTAVTDKFTPHDTHIEIASADDLSDAALASACSLHTAAPSSSSSTSSSQLHKLDDITEDAEEGQSTTGEVASASAKPATLLPSPFESASPAESDVKPLADKKVSEFSHVTIETVSEHDENTAPKTAPIETSFKNYDALFEDGPDPRLSSQTARPSLSDLYAEIYEKYNKPKVRLGPRPKAPKASLDLNRPNSSGSGSQGPPKPVSSLPSGLRAANRKTVATEEKRPKSRDSSTVPSIAFPPPPPIPAIPEIPSSPGNAPRSPISVKSMPMHTYSGLNNGSRGVTPEKQRLMKAIELRKKQMKAKQDREVKKAEGEAEAEAEAEGAVDVTTPEEAKEAKAVSQEVAGDDSTQSIKETSEQQNAGEDAEQATSQAVDETPQDETPQNAAEDFTADVSSIHVESDDMHSATSAASPISAQTHGSSCAPSTRPSSMSDDGHHASRDGYKPEVDADASGNVSEKPEEEAAVEFATEVAQEDEHASVESTSTVVPESNSAVPIVEVDPAEAIMAHPQASASVDVLAQSSKKEPHMFMSRGEIDDVRSIRKAKRESMLLPPLDNHDLAEERKQKRATLILSSPTGINFQENKDKKHALADPVNMSTAEQSEAEYLSDDSFMEELQSAKFEEAKPISVSKSPITPYFPKKNSISDKDVLTRSASTTVRSDHLHPEASSRPVSRKSSGSWLPPLPHTNSDSVVTAKKINVSSGISQRIKALAEKSNRDSIASVSPAATPDLSTSIVAQRKSSFFAAPPSGIAPNGKPAQRLSLAPFASRSSSASPDMKPKSQPPTLSREHSLNRQAKSNIQQEPEKPASVQVTARIIRDPQPQQPTLTMPTEITPLDLRQSSITIDHQGSGRPPSRKQSFTPEVPISPSSSHSNSKENGMALPRSSSESSWRTFGRRMSESRPAPSPRSRSSHSTESSDDKKEKKESRTTKLFKRISTMPSSKSRKNSTASSVLSEEDSASTQLPSLREPPSPVQIGDLNIQFPDTLLWKRRYVEIDVSGNLVFKPSKANELVKGVIKRFHLTEVQAPYLPDQDRQELPNSVVFDFPDGRALQCACETRNAQIHVLQSPNHHAVLKEAHLAWCAYNQGQ